MERRRAAEFSAPAVVSEALHVKYRPKSFEEVLGQDAVIKSLTAALKAAARPHCFLFCGPAGTGKTSLARLLAGYFKCADQNIIEVDAASNSGIDAMREVTAALQYGGFGETPNKMVILNEAQGLSKQAWDSLLTITEEPPSHVFFVLTTTNPSKVPQAVQTRFLSYELAPVSASKLAGLLCKVCDAENYPTPDAIIDEILEASGGSPRQALVNLAKVHDVTDPAEAATLMRAFKADKDVIDLVRLLISSKLDWRTLTETLARIPEPNAEGIRIVVSCYIAAILAKSKGGREVEDLCAIAYEFSSPYNPTDKLMPLFLSFERVINRR